MSARLDAAKALLVADSGNLVLVATGGIYIPNDLGRMGLNRTNTAAASAFASGIIKPCLVLKVRSNLPFGEVADDPAQRTGQREMMEVWAYADNSYSTIETMLARVYVLLQGKTVGGVSCRWAFDSPPLHDVDLDACVQRADYALISLR